MKITCIDIVRWKRGLSMRDLKLLDDPASPLVGNVAYRWHLLFKGPAGRDKLATRFWTYQRADGSRACGTGASWLKRRRRDWADLTKGVLKNGRPASGVAAYWTDSDIDDDQVKAAIRRSPKEVFIRTEERWYGEAELTLMDAAGCAFAFPRELGFEGQIKPEEYAVYYRAGPVESVLA